MVDIIIYIERHTFGLTIDVDKCDVPRWRGAGGGHTESVSHSIAHSKSL